MKPVHDERELDEFPTIKQMHQSTGVITSFLVVPFPAYW